VLDGGLPRWIAEGNEVETADIADVGESEYTGAKEPDEGVVKCGFSPRGNWGPYRGS
jgi:thiosulfate/3-mercaptopyruvate sulfurtransferase